MKTEFLECGKVCNAHGVRGAIKVESWCDSSKVLAGQKRIFIAQKESNFEEHKVLTASASGNFVIMTVDGIDTREKAIDLKNRTLYIKREDLHLEKGQMLLVDMIGLPVVDAKTQKVLGKIKDIDEGVQGLLYTVETEKGDVLFPSVPEFIESIDEEKGLVIRPIEGFFE